MDSAVSLPICTSSDDNAEEKKSNHTFVEKDKFDDASCIIAHLLVAPRVKVKKCSVCDMYLFIVLDFIVRFNGSANEIAFCYHPRSVRQLRW